MPSSATTHKSLLASLYQSAIETSRRKANEAPIEMLAQIAAYVELVVSSVPPSSFAEHRRRNERYKQSIEELAESAAVSVAVTGNQSLLTG